MALLYILRNVVVSLVKYLDHKLVIHEIGMRGMFYIVEHTPHAYFMNNEPLAVL